MTPIDIAEAVFVAALLIVALYALIRMIGEAREPHEEQEDDETGVHRLPEPDDPRS